ncbi:CYTH and CHAD domain-containing protein [Komagataeibacter sp. FNDCR2]|uniref:CYTH and CHAD domain-containing protein n=1 Tax=Komagataeibacter sp. FNDCR2 TaxID=2878682 RepID=UPI001E2C88D0|nr:CYTH and CHAD domain-containing protein [Komagataeibacter sp. FNDCR2]MCE2576567.1 CYTH and CHAD domain-containing protein [Komagataeibacter sp. FNDCR2]
MSGKDATPPLEIELKLLFPPDARPLLAQHLASMSMGQGRQEHLITTYYDSHDLALGNAGLSLRVRHVGQQRIQTLKATTKGNGLASHRAEWERVVKSDQPDLNVLSGTPAGPLLAALNGKLMPVWGSDVHRTTYTFQHDGATVEAAIDEGCIRAGEAQDMVRELELELKEGPVTALYSLALRLQAAVPLRLGMLTKTERGYHLLTGMPASSRQIDIPRLTKKTTLAEGFGMLVRAGVNTLIHNQPAAEAGDPEGIHQMRVAIRQLRTMLQMLKDHAARPTLDLFQSELQRIGHKLGEARDWDVLCLETLPAAFATQGDGDLIGLFNDSATEKRMNAHQQLCQELETPALTELMLSLMLWVEDRSFPGDGTQRAASLSHVAPVVLNRLARKVRRRGRHIHQLSSDERHALRKSLKKLRYGAQYFAGLHASRSVKTYMKRSKKLLRHLGEINDATVADTLVSTLGKTHPGLAVVAGTFADWNDKRRRKALHALPAAWKKFRNAEPFWH